MELAAGHPGQQLITFPHGDVGLFLRTWSGSKIFLFTWSNHSLPIFGCEAHTPHTTKSMDSWNWHFTALTYFGLLKSNLKTACICWPWPMAKRTKVYKNTWAWKLLIHLPHGYRVKWRTQPWCEGKRVCHSFVVMLLFGLYHCDGQPQVDGEIPWTLKTTSCPCSPLDCSL